MYETAVKIVKKLRNAGYEAYFAGGCVRNKILGKEAKDYDIATNAIPDVVQKMFPHTVAVGKAFGVVVVLENNRQFEGATFRADGKYSDNRRPDCVTFSDYKSDILRRDFTINGIFYDPIENKLIDIVGGEKDIKNRIICTIGNPIERFTEDKLRMMRAVRFSAQLGFVIESETENAIRKLANTITTISFERIRDELRLILLSDNRAEGLDMLYRLGLLKEILPEIVAMDGVPQPPEFHPEGDVFTHTKLCLKNLDNPTFELAMAALLHDVGKPPTFVVADRIRFNAHEVVGERIAKKICHRLKLSNDDTEKICWMVVKHMTFKDITNMRESTLKRLLASKHYDNLEMLFVADKLAADKDMSNYEYLKEMKAKFSVEDIRPEPLIGGKELIEMGFEPGPIFSVILDKVEDAQLEGKVKTCEEAIGFIREHFSDRI